MPFLPVREAVQTSVLARHWRHLWKSMPTLRIIDPWLLNWYCLKMMKRFVNYLVLFRDRIVPVDTCEIKFGAFVENTNYEPQVDLLIRYALSCQARILKVELDEENNSFGLDELPLISQHLMRLELSYVALIGNFLDFSSCPALEVLWIKHCYIHGQKISSQSLKELTIIDCIFF
ncbi:hypothetical protein E2562_001942 [Oryza meyeriana var. granulata]|uniref:FBD domain-containing protein n=1 Tax=Oryza meyeriana var. granulata TaxID=110450 RepID=A0A6G1C342_9ORYZ|nr:hypothetical protein E2562_001942 [Oryza meyeriana var. granulata]